MSSAPTSKPICDCIRDRYLLAISSCRVMEDGGMEGGREGGSEERSEGEGEGDGEGEILMGGYLQTIGIHSYMAYYVIVSIM